MTEPTHNTIDSILQSDRFEEINFSPLQRGLIRTFFQDSLSAWAKPNTSQRRVNATGRKRSRPTSTLPELRTGPRTSFEPITRPETSLSTTNPHNTTISRSPSTSASASPSPATSRHTSISPPILPVVAATTIAPVSRRLHRIGTPTLHLVSQEFDESRPHIGEEELVTSYSSINDIDGFVKGLKDFQVQGNRLAFPQDTSHDVTLFSLYVTAKSQERMSKTVAKIAATVLVSLYPSQQLTPAAVKVC
jgi:hypothetical protein